MRVLLDTCVFLWLTAEPNRISRKATAALDDLGNELFVCLAGTRSIGVKGPRRGK